MRKLLLTLVVLALAVSVQTVSADEYVQGGFEASASVNAVPELVLGLVLSVELVLETMVVLLGQQLLDQINGRSSYMISN
jgi:hypothetical protein